MVSVLEAKDLVGPDPNSTALFDTYVRVYLLPDKSTNLQTRVRDHVLYGYILGWGSEEKAYRPTGFQVILI